LAKEKRKKLKLSFRNSPFEEPVPLRREGQGDVKKDKTTIIR